MSKISKFIICCIAVIISIVSLCVPTYCLSPYEFTLESWENLNNNFYNSGNTNYLKYTNLSIKPKLINDSYYIVVNGTWNNKVSLPYTWRDSLVVYGSPLENGEFSQCVLDLQFKILGSPTGSQFNVEIVSYKTSYNDWFIDLSSTRSYGLTTFYYPIALNEMFSSITGYRVLSYLDYTFNIEYNNQYFYNQMFGINLYMATTYLVDNSFSISYFDNLNNVFTYNTTITDYYNNVLKNESIYNMKKVLLLNNKFSYENSYINKVKISTNGSWSWCTLIGDGYLPYPSNAFYLNTVSYNNTVTFNRFIYSSFLSDVEYSALIPNGSNDYYKTAEWWDIPAHLYNFLIYLVFDAPIVSNFTNLVMVLINFIVEIFEFFISLFSGIENIFFISIFLGIIVLIFLLKIIFKG